MYTLLMCQTFPATALHRTLFASGMYSTRCWVRSNPAELPVTFAQTLPFFKSAPLNSHLPSKAQVSPIFPPFFLAPSAWNSRLPGAQRRFTALHLSVNPDPEAYLGSQSPEGVVSNRIAELSHLSLTLR